MIDSDSREGGIDFGRVRERLREQEYPRTGEAVIDDCGAATLTFAGGELTVRDALAACRDHTFRSAADVEATLFSMVPIGAVGRKRYTDRGCLTTRPGATGSV